jgi:hypothetical protein
MPHGKDKDGHKGNPAPIVPPTQPGGRAPSGDGTAPPGDGKHRG